MKILSSIRYFARQRLPLRSQSGSKIKFLLITSRNGITKKQTDLFQLPFKIKF